MPRKAVPEETQNKVLIQSRRRCCVCFWLSGVDEIQKGQIAHLDKDNTNFAEDNQVFLCLEHHDEYDGKTRQSKGLREKEVRHWRDELYKEMAYRFRVDVERQKRQEKFDYLEDIMADLFKVMRRELKKHPLWRYAVIRETRSEYEDSLKLFAYLHREVPELWDKLGVLVNQDLLTKSEHFYKLSETLVDYLRKS
jgi:hypothetical protein